MAPRRRARGLTLFVTVGSTRFEELTDYVRSDSFVDKLLELGFNRMIIQYGKVNKYNSKFVDDEKLKNLSCKIDIEAYEYQPSIKDDIKAADLVIGHAGAGTCLEVLRMNRRLLLVVNENLMDNHQKELADELSKSRYVMNSTVDTLCQNLELICQADLAKFPPKNPSKFEEIFNEALKKVNSRL